MKSYIAYLYAVYIAQATLLNTKKAKDDFKLEAKIEKVQQTATKTTEREKFGKVEEKKVIVESSDDEIKKAFELFDQNGNGKINPKEIKQAMQDIGYDEKNPLVYQIVAELDTPHYNKAGGVNFNDFCQTVNNRIPERETTEDLRKVFNLFLDDPNDTTTSLASIKRVADELGENFEEAELNAMLTKASKSGANLTFEDFVSIMTGNEQI